jgi:hypothetical protein
MTLLNICPCCGYDGLLAPSYSNYHTAVVSNSNVTPPYCLVFGDASYEVCKCCGFEFGLDDEPGTAEPMSFEAYFDEWVRAGCIWFDKSGRPSDWKPHIQFRRSLFMKAT